MSLKIKPLENLRLSLCVTGTHTSFLTKAAYYVTYLGGECELLELFLHLKVSSADKHACDRNQNAVNVSLYTLKRGQ